MIEAGSSNFKCEVLSRSSSRYGLEHGVGVVHWIYTRFKMFLECANIELDYHKVKFEGAEITQEQAIDIILAECERFILSNNIDSVFDKKVWKLIGKILPAMWW